MNDGEVEGGGARISEEDKENRVREEDAMDRTCRLPRQCCTLREYRVSSMQRGAARHDVSSWNRREAE